MNKQFNDLPLIDFIFDEKEGNIAKAISMVTHPAIEQDGIYFNDDFTFKFKVEDDEKRLFTGPAMIADLPIYRNLNGFEFMGRFSAEQIEKYRDSLFRDSRDKMTIVNHNEVEINDGVFIVESWIVNDPNNDKSSNMGFESNKGDWYVTYKVENDFVWEKIKSGEIMGFSIEGTFGLMDSNFKVDDNLLNVNELEDLDNKIEAELKNILFSDEEDFIKLVKIIQAIDRFEENNKGYKYSTDKCSCDSHKFNEDITDEDKNGFADFLENNPDFGVPVEDLVDGDFVLDLNEYGNELEEEDYKIILPNEIDDEFSVPTGKSLDGTGIPLTSTRRDKITLYKYASPFYGSSNVGQDTRDFCRRVVSVTNTRLLTFRQIQQLNNQNPGLGKNGSNTYSVFKYRGGTNCRHRWYKFIYDLKERKFIKSKGQPYQPNV